METFGKLGEAELYPYSLPIDRNEVVRSGALTSLPVRIHRYNHLADAGALCLTDDWQRAMQDGQHKRSNGSPSIVGNWASFIWPECRPERLGLLCYILDAGCFHDDACEEISISAAHQEHLDFADAMEVRDGEAKSRGNDHSHSVRIKNLISTAVLECIKVDRAGAMRMLEAYGKKWLRVMETYKSNEIDNIDDYFEARANNGGMGAYYAMLEFSLGITITDSEYDLMSEAIRHVERCMLLTNDYWSWPREREQAKHQETGKVFNIVWFLMHTNKSWSEDDAIVKVRKMVYEEEQKWVEAKKSLYQKVPNLGRDAIKFLENLHTALAGNDYWSSQCYRHNDWKHVPELPGKCAPRVNDLVGLGRALLRNESDLDDADNVAATLHSHKSTHSQSSCTTPPSPRSPAINPHLPCSSTSGFAKSPVTGPIDYIRSLPSKKVRTQLIDSLNIWFSVPHSALSVIKEVVDCLHDSSLILDDVEDGSDLRRGFPATHVVYGTGQAVNSATFLYVQAVEAVHRLVKEGGGRLELMDVLLASLKELFQGQSCDLYWTHHRICPTEKEYLYMVDRKTGAMMQLLVGLMQIAATSSDQRYDSLDPTHLEDKDGARQRLLRFTQLFGRFFQVRDDYLNISSCESSYMEKKGFAEDLDEQKFSYILVHMYARNPEARDKVEGVFKAARQMGKEKHDGIQWKRYILGLLEESGALNATRQVLVEWHKEMMAEIGELEREFGAGNGMLRLLVEMLRI
ncbi:terpenoid synthase [Colletotrichum eremochloae]|uniref:(-)-variculatriene B n=1 Tax=Colletotrichum sublineola TaxID=1173701 RepID=A0A8F4PNJ7_COLSU|nr:terpenoid synthase [Colletotrichum eremochloae]QXF69099.1 (-)-variculatriene B [Colletotrichum sublineola]